MMIAPLPGATALKPGSASLPLPGIAADVVDEEGRSLPAGQGGYLVLRQPWPGMMRTVHGDEARFRKSYWGALPLADGKPIYFAGDGVHRDEDGYFWIMGRVDDVINVSGHRLGTMEIESALVSHPAVAEAAVVGRPDELKGSAVAAFVTLEVGRHGDICFTDVLPKTRSGKIICAAFCGPWPVGKPSRGTSAPWRMPRCWSGCGGLLVRGLPIPSAGSCLRRKPQ